MGGGRWEVGSTGGDLSSSTLLPRSSNRTGVRSRDWHDWPISGLDLILISKYFHISEYQNIFQIFQSVKSKSSF